MADPATGSAPPPKDADGPVLTPVMAEMAAVLGVAPLDEATARSLLRLAGDVAHRSERRNAPLAAFLVGAWFGSGGDLSEGRRRVLNALDRIEPG